MFAELGFLRALARDCEGHATQCMRPEARSTSQGTVGFHGAAPVQSASPQVSEGFAVTGHSFHVPVSDTGVGFTHSWRIRTHIDTPPGHPLPVKGLLA